MKQINKLDLRRLLCPMPVIRLGEAVNNLTTGDIVEMTCTDQGVLHDIPAWCSVHGHKVIKVDVTEKEIVLFVEVVG